MKRDCPICSGSAVKRLYQQTFSQMSGGFPIRGYDVVVCEACGFGYADGTPDQKQMDSYYKDLSKYENKHQAGEVSQAGLENYQKIVDGLSTFLPDKTVRIADIGCATGALLSVFQRNGYRNLQGVDPSPSCARTAAELYRIPVLTSSLFDVKPFEQPFDVLVFSSVLEHVIDLGNALERMRNLLAPGGLIYIDVPDTVSFATWISAPLQQFSVEHVNFFSSTSLSNLLRRHGCGPVAFWHELRALGAIGDPALCGVFRKTDEPDLTTVRDHETEAGLRRYIQLSQKDDVTVRSRIDSLVSNKQSILVWGTGTQVQRLLASTNFGNARIRAFVDSNANYQGKEFNGLPILAPSELHAYSEPIVICTRVFQEEIATQIREELGLDNDIIKLFATTAA